MISPRTSAVYRTAAGLKLRGTFSEPQSTFSDDESLARRILHTHRHAPITTGGIVIAHEEEYLMVEHSTAKTQKRLLAYQITDRVVWNRIENVVDPVTKMKKGDTPVEESASFPIALEPVSIKDEKNLERVKYRLRCPTGPKANDTLGNLRVHTVKDIGGVSVIEAY